MNGPEETPRPRRLFLHVGLFLATFLTTTAAGAIFVHGQGGSGSFGWGGIMPIADGLSYSLPLMLILLSHELGHYVVARLYGVDASLPYFIPLPPSFGLGTMGAVIGMRRVTSDRKKLIDIGAAGPLAGLLVAIPVIWYGLSQSQIGPMVAGGLQEGNSILYAIIKRVAKGAWLPDGQQDVLLHPTAWAGWAGLWVTMINLLPIGQLDGGHIATAYFGNRYNRIAGRLHLLLPIGAVAVFAWALHLVRAEGSGWGDQMVYSVAVGAALPWIVLFVLVKVLRRVSGGENHPPVDEKPLPRSRRLLFWVMVAVFVAVFMPIPSRMTLIGSPPPEPPAETAALL